MKISNNCMSKDILNVIKQYDSIVIFSHVTPDCDCYGSLVALKEIIKINFPSKEVYAVGSGVASFFSILGELDKPSDEIIKNSLGILLDVSHPERSEDQRVYLTKEIIKIDHHIEEKEFTGTKWVDNDSIATCELLAEFAVANSLELNKKAATALFLGIVTDSGRFMYQPTSGKTYELISYLFTYDVNYKELFDILYQQDPKIMKYKGYMLQNFKRSEHGVLYFIADKNLYKEFDLEYDDVSHLVNVFNNVKDCPIWLLFTENPDGIIRVEFRSNGLNIQPIASRFGGGGHHCASGARIQKDEHYKVEEIIKACDELIVKGE